MQVRHHILVVVPLALALLAGCGGSSDSTNSPPGLTTGAEASDGPPPTRAQFVKEANAVCARDRERISEELVEYLQREKKNEEGQTGAASAINIVKGAVVPAFEGEIKHLQALQPPAGESKKVTSVVAGIETMLEEAERDPPGFASSQAPYAQAEKAADANGLTQCGRP